MSNKKKKKLAFIKHLTENVRFRTATERIEIVLIGRFEHLSAFLNRLGNVAGLNVAAACVSVDVHLNRFDRLLDFENLLRLREALEPFSAVCRFLKLLAQLSDLFNAFVECKALLMIGIELQTLSNLPKMRIFANKLKKLRQKNIRERILNVGNVIVHLRVCKIGLC